MKIDKIGSFKRIVIKIGSSLLVDQKNHGLRNQWLESLAADIAKLIGNQSPKNKPEILIVTSGSIALGRTQLNWHDRILRLEEKQAAAAIGQTRLMESYQKVFAPYALSVAQILLTFQDTEERKRHLNAREAILQLLELGFIPIINENDTVATSEIRYGDNDRLAARVATMVSADLLILLSDVDGLYRSDPRKDPDAEHIPLVKELTKEIVAMAGGAPKGYSSGGMVTKLEAARIAIGGGCHMIIAKGEAANPLARLQSGEACTHFLPNATPLQARKGWIGGSLKPKGQIMIDQGAMNALLKGNSLLPSGVKQVIGNFDRGDPIAVCLMPSDMSGNDKDNTKDKDKDKARDKDKDKARDKDKDKARDKPQMLAIGLSAYNAKEADLIKSHHSREIAQILGYEGRPSLIHRDDLVLLPDQSD